MARAEAEILQSAAEAHDSAGRQSASLPDNEPPPALGRQNRASHSLDTTAPGAVKLPTLPRSAALGSAQRFHIERLRLHPPPHPMMMAGYDDR